VYEEEDCDEAAANVTDSSEQTVSSSTANYAVVFWPLFNKHELKSETDYDYGREVQLNDLFCTRTETNEF
jgi:hypothetical protein